MSELGFTPDEAISVISENKITNYIFASTLALVVYDTLLCLPQEFRCVWKRRLGIVTILYLLIRYGIILNMVLRIFSQLYIYTDIPRWDTFCLDISCSIAAAVFDCLRIWGITQHRWFPALLVFTLSMFDPAINIYNYAIPESYQLVPSGPLAGCWTFSTAQEYIYFSYFSHHPELIIILKQWVLSPDQSQ
ncbi:hypothetical protein QCA50_012372 [Cerrena zonata]|uniref:DUF6533 domain-containing protein n=1 Tax=Cerrena zonata TaxID=2478898 RepID=A0AAW0FZY2_9APHY